MKIVYNLPRLAYVERISSILTTTEEPQFGLRPTVWSSSPPSSGNIFMYSGLEGTGLELLDGGTVKTGDSGDQGMESKLFV